MGKRIKTLYTITILVILGFLGLQIYWLLTRYEYSLTQYEDATQKDIMEVLDSYRHERIAILDSVGGAFMNPTSYSVTRIPHRGGKDFKVTRTKISAPGYAQKVLGIKDNRPLTQDELLKAAEIINDNESLRVALQTEATLHNPPSESAVMDALKNYDLEMNVPLQVSTLDSILLAKGYDAEVVSVRTDSIEWLPSLRRHTSILSPVMQVCSPYSEMDNKSVRITVHIPSSHVLAGMADTLAIACVISLLLIACLIYQFSTIVGLDRLDKMRTEFTSTMIHELKRPVSTLKMCVSGLANEKMNSDPEMRGRLMGQTRKALDLLSAYFSKMRDLTFNNARQIPLRCERLNPADLFDESASRVSVPQGKSVELINNIDRNTGIYADRAHLANIFINLVENAVKYSGDRVTVRACSATDRDGNISISVSDNGNGIAASDIPRIFSQFYRGAAARSDVPGMGLGLAYVRMLVEAHGGSVSVQSLTEGHDKGTCFTINIPQT